MSALAEGPLSRCSGYSCMSSSLSLRQLVLIRIRLRSCVSNFRIAWHRIIAARIKRVASSYAQAGQVQPSPEAVQLKRTNGVLRTRRRKPAHRGHEPRYGPLVQPDEADGQSCKHIPVISSSEAWRHTAGRQIPHIECDNRLLQPRI